MRVSTGLAQKPTRNQTRICHATRAKDSIMTDLILETLRTAVILVIFLYLWRAGRNRAELSREGWRLLLGGFALLLFGSAIDITDNFESLNRYVLIGDTAAQAFLDKMVGSLGGFSLVSFGLVRWLPTLSSVRRTELLLAELSQTNERLAASETRLLEQTEIQHQVEGKLRQKMSQLERFNHLTQGRELRIIDMKREVNEMAHKAGVAPPYESIGEVRSESATAASTQAEPTEELTHSDR